MTIDYNKYPIVTSSPQAQSLTNSRHPDIGFKPKYPWRELEVGQSFPIDMKDKGETEIKKRLADIQNQSYRKNKLMKRNFKVYYHKDDKLIEVARLPDTVGTVEKPKASFFEGDK